MKILVVDDSKAMRMIVIRTLKQTGFDAYDVAEASNGVEALDHLREGGFDIVFSGFNMPEMNGMELWKTIQEEEIKVAFGLVTSEGRSELKVQAREAGVNFVIPKPFTPEAFASVLEPILAN